MKVEKPCICVFAKKRERKKKRDRDREHRNWIAEKENQRGRQGWWKNRMRNRLIFPSGSNGFSEPPQKGYYNRKQFEHCFGILSLWYNQMHFKRDDSLQIVYSYFLQHFFHSICGVFVVFVSSCRCWYFTTLKSTWPKALATCSYRVAYFRLTFPCKHVTQVIVGFLNSKCFTIIKTELHCVI